jgi:hypothetical protein
MGVRGEVIKELFGSFHSGRGAFGLLDGDGTQRHQNRDVDGPSIIQDAADNTLYILYALRGQGGGCVGRERRLCGGTVLFRRWCVWAMLWTDRHAMFIRGEEFHDVTRHRNVDGSVLIIPVERNSTVQVSRPVFDDIVRLFDGVYQVRGVFFTHIFHPKIVND